MNVLTHPDRSAFLRGVVRSVDTPAGVLLHRTTARQLDHLDRLRPGSGVRGRCNAGQQITLLTDARRLEIVLGVGTGARRAFAVAVSVDARCTHPVYERDLPDGDVALTLELGEPAALRLVRLHLHGSRVTTLRRLEAVDGTTVLPAPRAPRRLLCYGDSITQGMDTISPLAPHPEGLATFLDAELLNLGIGGHVFDADFLDPDLPFVPDLVTIAYGANDWMRGLPADHIGQQATAFLRKVAAIHPGARRAVLTPIWCDRGNERKTAGTLPQVGAVIAAAAAAEPGVIVIDGQTLVPNEARFFVDGTHPNDLGFGHYTANLIRALRQWAA